MSGPSHVVGICRLDVFDMEPGEQDMVFKQAQPKVTVALAGLKPVAEQDLAINHVCGHAALNPDAYLVPVSGNQQVGRVIVFLDEWLDIRAVHGILAAEISPEARGGIIIAAIAYIKQVHGVVLAEYALPPCSAFEQVVGMHRVVGCPEAVHVTEPVVFASVGHHLYAVGDFVIAGQPLIVPQCGAIRSRYVHGVSGYDYGHIAGRILYGPVFQRNLRLAGM